MLTKNDLQAIKKLIISEGDSIKSEVRVSLKDEIDATLDKHLKSIKKDIRKIKKNGSVMLDMLNRDDMHLLKRVKRVEEHLKLPPFPQN